MPFHTHKTDEEEDESTAPETAFAENSPPAPVVPKRGYKNILFIHEPQVDFYGGGACCGPSSSGSTEYGAKIAEFIENNLDNIDDIIVTLDSHSVSVGV